MEISGLRALDSNYYNLLTIFKNNIVVQRVDLRGKLIRIDYGREMFKGLDNPISSQIANLDDNEQISKVIDYFLDYDMITGISDSVLIDKKRFLIIDGIDYCGNKRRLRLGKGISQEFISQVFEKYKIDRDRFLSNLEIDDTCDIFFRCEAGKTYYEGESNSIINFGLALEKTVGRNKKLVDSELVFLDNVLSYVFDSKYVQIYDELNSEGDAYTGNQFTISDLGDKRKVHIPTMLVPYATSLIKKHNDLVRENKLNNDKVLQLKMEGF